ncbi:MAG TPA: hypothetical protein DEQ61_04215 [Streptomyces sp.]|nr:hypothetical protein [Streptomyces sp.]
MTSELPELRASDADRDRVAEVLREAVAEGRLDMAEFDERLDAAYRARIYAELEPLTRDLPAAGAAAPPVVRPAAGAVAPEAVGDASWPARIGGTATSKWAVAVMSGFQRRGRWVVPRRFTAVAFWGGGEIDLREARFEDREVVIRCFALMGGMNVVVPPGVELDVRGIGIMGGFDHANVTEGEPGAPRVVITGLAIWGGVGTERKVPKDERRRLKAERKQRHLEHRQRHLEHRHDRRLEKRDRRELGD